MTTFEPALTMLAAWLRPVLPTVDEETMELCRSWVAALAESESVTAQDLARAAFGKASRELTGTLETVIANTTATYSPGGKAELISHVSAAALLHCFDKSSAHAIEMMACCESLLFLGWVPVIGDLPARLYAFADAQARRTRERIPLGVTTRLARKVVASGGDTDEDKIQRLSADLSEVHQLLNRATKRLDAIVAQFNDRLALLDEEVDALWWARSGFSSTTGQAWSSLSSLERAILAGIEVADIVGSRPPTAGTLVVLDQAIGSSDETFDLVDVVVALGRAGWTGRPARNKSHAPFRPLATGIASMSEFNDDTDVVSKALSASLLIPGGHKVSPSAVARQLLTENALQDDDD